MLTSCIPKTKLDQLIIDVQIVHVILEYGWLAREGGKEEKALVGVATGKERGT